MEYLLKCLDDIHSKFSDNPEAEAFAIGLFYVGIVLSFLKDDK